MSDRTPDPAAVFGALPAPYVLLTPDFTIVLASDAFLRANGWQREQLIGRDVFAVFAALPTDPQANARTMANLHASLARVLDTRAPDEMAVQRYDIPLPGQPGLFQQKYWSAVNSPVLDDAGNVAYIVHYVKDVTARMRGTARRDALRSLADAWRDVRAPREIVRTALEILGEVLGVSRVSFGRYNDATDTLYVGPDWCTPGIPSLEGTVHLREFGSFVDEMLRGEAVVVHDVAQDPRTAAHAGPFRRHHAQSFVDIPVIEQGRLKSILVVSDTVPRQWAGEDVTLMREFAERIRTASERARSMEALATSEAKFRSITNAMPQMVWSTLPDGWHDYFNAQWYDYTGMPPGSTDGVRWNEMFHPDDRERAWAAWQHSLDTGDVYEIQYRLRHRSGEYRWTLGRALPVRDDTGRIIRWMGTCTDIHSQKLAEDALREAAARKDEFLAMLAHELRNPLAPIGTAAQLLQGGLADEKTRIAASNIISRQVRHMAHLVDDLLDVSRVTRGLVQLNMADLDLAEVVASAVEQALPLIDERRHALDLDLPDIPARVHGDRTRLVQVIANLLNNAAKYTPHGGRIALHLDVVDSHARVTVRDNGNGIAPTLLPHIFDLFIQGERNPDRAQGGLGLGLTLVKSITMLHDGFVTAHSDGPGRGSEFAIHLPLLEGVPAAAHAPAETRRPAARALRLLVVEDNPDAAGVLAELLRSEGHDVAVAEDAEAALRRADLAATDAFILDIGLPGMDGYTLARHLRADPATAGATLIALTGYGQPSDRAQSHAAGFNRHLVKPADPAELLLALQAV
ncbi:PAS domain-containing protein [Pseudoduganella sp. SL102]|uniref:ATP-binding protein n=1 Tax=Pseudoduganella sp. SL102 TaxID=2995154 RepID=UPI00248BA83A|nr:ATP-binding protein [Pseudoduganella sp. SL102]WBS04168.1 PAS domain-containing protein [Pseudoduganella sp. SL102]